MNENQERRYLSQGEVKCPYCQSYNIEGKPLKVDIGSVKGIVEEVHCRDCDKNWLDYYRLWGRSWRQ